MKPFNNFNFFQNSEQIQAVLFLATLILCWNVERIAGIRFGYKKWKHAFINVPFAIFSIPIQITLGIFFIQLINWTGHHHFGIIYHLPFIHSSFIIFIITFLLLDFGEYIYHVLMHKVKALWLFHVVHHSDQIVDSSTTFREHPGETVIRLIFTMLWVFLIGAFFWAFVLRQIIQAITTMFAHLNYQLPKRIDFIIGTIFVTPNLHHVHHHFEAPYTDSNYGDVLIIWDKIFGTKRRLNKEELVFGIDRYVEKECSNKFFELIKVPFKKYKKDP